MLPLLPNDAGDGDDDDDDDVSVGVGSKKRSGCMAVASNTVNGGDKATIRTGVGGIIVPPPPDVVDDDDDDAVSYDRCHTHTGRNVDW